MKNMATESDLETATVRSAPTVRSVPAVRSVPDMRSVPASKSTTSRKIRLSKTSKSHVSSVGSTENSETGKESLCPHRKLNTFITNGIILLLIWCVSWAITGPDVLPGGNLFGLMVIFYSAVLGGKLLECIRIPSVPPLPPLLGMLLAGFTVRNIPFLSNLIFVNSMWSSTLRNIALTVILVQAGLGLDPQVLKTMKGVCLRLSVGPCLAEALASAVISHFLLGFPWKWGFLLGFVLGAVSPAVVVPSMIMMQEKGYGVQKGIPTLLMASSSLDDILAFTGFHTCLSLVFSTGNILSNILNSIRDVVIGVLVGVLLGFFARYFPSRDQEYLHLKRAFVILGLCISAVLGGKRIGLHATGGLCTLVLTFMVSLSWTTEKVSVQSVVSVTWNVFQPLLFGLVGSEINVSALETNTIGIAIATVTLAVLARISFTFSLMSFSGFNVKEKLFIALAWIPKATVQAVLGPLALETARTINAPQLEQYSKDVMTVAFLAILITAPNGALIIGILGPKMLKCHDPGTVKTDLTIVPHH